jgi:F-type H+-transporting ATPase subunit delta
MNDLASDRYAESLIQLARERGELDRAYADMEQFTRTLTGSPELGRVLRSPVIPSEKKLAILTQLFSERFTPLTMQFIALVSRRNREGLLAGVANSFKVRYLALQGITQGQVTTATPLSEAELAKIMALAEKVTGKKMQLEQLINPEVIGGYLLRIGDNMIDQTVRNQLARVRRQLKTTSV